MQFCDHPGQPIANINDGWCGCGGTLSESEFRLVNSDKNGCVFEYIIFLNDPTEKIWKRLKNGEEGNPNLEPSPGWNCEFCGVKPGKMHHIECDFEICPRCREQIPEEGIEGHSCNDDIDDDNYIIYMRSHIENNDINDEFIYLVSKESAVGYSVGSEDFYTRDGKRIIQNYLRCKK